MTPRRGSDAPPATDPMVAALRRQAMIVEHLYDGIIVTDQSGVILDWNPGAERMFGYTRADVVGKSAELLNRPGEGSAISQVIQAGMRDEGRWTGELTAMAKDGSEPVGNTPQEFARWLPGELAKWAKVAQVARMHVE